MPRDIIVRRKGDRRNDSLEIHLSHDGDVFVKVRGVDSQGNQSEAQVEFCAPNGGGYHPQTIIALHKLAKAIKQDNKDQKSPKRYRD
jgi:hypothetical protein